MANTELIRIAGLSEAERKIITGSLSTEERKEVLLQAAREKQKEGNISLEAFSKAILKGRVGYYKDCEILEISPISEKYWLVVCRLPLPRGGTYEEIVHINSLVELRGQ